MNKTRFIGMVRVEGPAERIESFNLVTEEYLNQLDQIEAKYAKRIRRIKGMIERLETGIRHLNEQKMKEVRELQIRLIQEGGLTVI